MIGFLSEHTVEFVLVPRLKSILAARFGVVTPVYFWKTREGNSLSSLIHKNELVRVLAMFPRRPKLKSPTEKAIWGKINRELFEYSRASFSAGIPAIAGLPLTHSLLELWENREPMWILLANESPEDVIFKVEAINRKIVSVRPKEHNLEIMREVDIPIFVEENASIMTWSETINAINTLRMEPFFGRVSFLGGYKPTYFFIFDRCSKIGLCT